MVVMVVVAMLVIVYDMSVVMLVGVAFVACAAEKLAYLVRSHVWDHVESLLEVVCNSWDIVCLHYREHHLAVDGQGDIYLSAFDHGGPVLIAYGVSEFEGCAYDSVVILVGDPSKVDDEYGIQFKSEHSGFTVVGVVSHDVSIYNLCVSGDSYGIFFSGCAFGKET